MLTNTSLYFRRTDSEAQVELGEPLGQTCPAMSVKDAASEVLYLPNAFGVSSSLESGIQIHIPVGTTLRGCRRRSTTIDDSF